MNKFLPAPFQPILAQNPAVRFPPILVIRRSVENVRFRAAVLVPGVTTIGAQQTRKRGHRAKRDVLSTLEKRLRERALQWEQSTT
jgi:hypothetical protein